MPEPTSTRRDVLHAAGASAVGGTLSALATGGTVAARVAPAKVDDGTQFEIEREQDTSVFPLSVASGGPTPNGVLLWTRVAPDAYDGATDLGVEIAADREFETPVYRGTVRAATFGPDRDHTVTVDVNDHLEPDRSYFYRFVYDGHASEVGRCRTLPAPDASPESVRFAVASCNHYLHGYFGAFARIADADVDFLVHLGDFIYEDAGDGVGDRSIELPSGHGKAYGLSDFRHLYRTYRSDPHLRRALRNHTLIHAWDDHEIVGDRWWDYEANAPATAAHPRGDDPAFMRQLYVDGIRAYTEYVPARVTYEPNEVGELPADAIHEHVRLYRSFQFGDLAELFVTDERLYRAPPPEPETGGASVSAATAVAHPGRTMLGGDQRRWLLDGMIDSDARWTLWGNEVLLSAFRFVRDRTVTVNADAWDGYWRERRRVLSRLADAGVENLVVLTGDMHSYLVGYLLRNYDLVALADSMTDVDELVGLSNENDRVGVEFMAPAVSSDNLVAMGYLPTVGTEAFVAALRAANPHVEWFDSGHWGYATVEVTRDDVVYSAYAVDRSVDSADPPTRLLRRYRVPARSVDIERLDDG